MLHGLLPQQDSFEETGDWEEEDTATSTSTTMFQEVLPVLLTDWRGVLESGGSEWNEHAKL